MGKYAVVLGIAATVVLADQVTKRLIVGGMSLNESIAVIDSLFHITYVRNRGGAFSILSEQPDWLRIPFFVTVSLAAFAALFYFVRGIEAGQRVLLFALGGILGGALGNFIDRVTQGTVVDFLDFHWRGYYWPAFNVADMFISVGTVVVLLHSFLAKEESGS